MPEADWESLGLFQPRPRYEDQVYLSMRCAPSVGECQLFHTLLRRSPLAVREAVSEIDESEKLLKSGMLIEDFIKVNHYF